MDISSLSNLTTSAAGLSSLLLVTPIAQGFQPQATTVSLPYKAPSFLGNTNPKSFLFHYEGEQTVTLESDITDHYVEDNSAIQDNITVKPELITTHGFIGELNNVVPLVPAVAQQAFDKLVALSAYTPALSVSALLAYNLAVQAAQAVIDTANNAVSAWNTVGGAIGAPTLGGQTTAIANTEFAAVQNLQQQAFQMFYGYWRNRTLFTVQTPWAIFPNVAIKSLRAIQNADTAVITDFEVSFKVIRFASTITTNTAPNISSDEARTGITTTAQLGNTAVSGNYTLSQNTTLPSPASGTG